MTDFINKLLGVFLSFILLAGAPLVITDLSNRLIMERSVLNQMDNLINKVTDNARLSTMDLSDFYLSINSFGIAMDGSVKRYIKVVAPDGSGGTTTTYVASTVTTDWNKGDFIQVHVDAIDFTGSQRIINRFLHLSPPKFDVTLAGMVVH